jgi:hypothetical protein
MKSSQIIEYGLARRHIGILIKMIWKLLWRGKASLKFHSSPKRTETKEEAEEEGYISPEAFGHFNRGFVIMDEAFKEMNKGFAVSLKRKS